MTSPWEKYEFDLCGRNHLFSSSTWWCYELMYFPGVLNSLAASSPGLILLQDLVAPIFFPYLLGLTGCGGSSGATFAGTAFVEVLRDCDSQFVSYRLPGCEAPESWADRSRPFFGGFIYGQRFKFYARIFVNVRCSSENACVIWTLHPEGMCTLCRLALFGRIHLNVWAQWMQVTLKWKLVDALK